jgi:hypothetical protein
MNDCKKIFLIKTESQNPPLLYQKCVELNSELEEKILLEVLNKWGTGTEEGYIDKITHEVFQKLKESVSSEGLSKEKEVL